MTARQRQPSVLVHHSSWHLTQLIVSDLARHGARVEMAGSSEWVPARFSRFVQRFHRVPPLEAQPAEFVESVCRVCREREINLFLPSCHEVFTLAPFRQRLWDETRYPFSSTEVLAKVDDKARLLELARDAGIQVPRTMRVQAAPTSLPAELSFPIAFKPVIEASARGFGIAHSIEELRRGLTAHSNPTGRGWLLQELVSGPLVVWNGIFVNGTLKASFHFETLRTHPASGGASVLRRSAWIPELDSQVSRLLSAVAYEGFCNIDFLVDRRSGAYLLIDFNPRFGTSLHAAMAVGISFPWYLLKLARSEDFLPPEYPIGVESISILGHLRRVVTGRQGRLSRIRLAGEFLGALGRLRQAEDFDAGDPLPLLLAPVCGVMHKFRSETW